MSACCEAWERAQARGSDCEAYGAALYDGGTAGWLLCGVGARVRFCPWCGAQKDKAAAPPVSTRRALEVVLARLKMDRQTTAILTYHLKHERAKGDPGRCPACQGDQCDPEGPCRYE